MARMPEARSLAVWRRRAIERMSRSRAATLALLDRLPEGALLTARTQGDWSIKDVLVHIAAWEEEGRRRLALIARGRGHRIVWYDTMAEADRFNTRAVQAARKAGLPAVRRRLARARAGLIRTLKRLPPRALADPTHDLPVTRWLREFAWTHERAHRRDIREWWRTARGR
ncbi:MAG TPA: DinB family protein [Methylomirabilota bacterium]|jgi:hypothetical protein|nr:DinB family protein [Methylomirabilota bacterium]